MIIKKNDRLEGGGAECKKMKKEERMANSVINVIEIMKEKRRKGVEDRVAITQNRMKREIFKKMDRPKQKIISR